MLSAICDNSTNCYKQKAHFNDSMSDRKPLIFTRDSFSLLFGMFYTSRISCPSLPGRGAYASRVAISDLFIPPETHDRFLG